MMAYGYTFGGSLLLASMAVCAGQSMKCVDGSGRVIYTELPSCVQAFRASPTPPRQISPEAAQAEAIKVERSKLLKEVNLLEQQKKDRRYQEKLDANYREKQRLMAEDEHHQQECAQMLVESDQRYNNAMAHGNDGWWRRRSLEYDQEMEKKCGHEVRLRR